MTRDELTEAIVHLKEKYEVSTQSFLKVKKEFIEEKKAKITKLKDKNTTDKKKKSDQDTNKSKKTISAPEPSSETASKVVLPKNSVRKVSSVSPNSDDKAKKRQSKEDNINA